MDKDGTEKRHKETMRKWDYWRMVISTGDRSSAPRDWFESEIDARDEKIDRLTTERDKLRYAIDNILGWKGTTMMSKVIEIAEDVKDWK